MFSTQNYASLADTQTGLPLAEIFFQATQTKGGAFGLVFMVWIALGPCVIGSQLSKFKASKYSVQLLTLFQALEEFFGPLLEMMACLFLTCMIHPFQ